MVYAHDLPVFLYDEEERSDDSDRWDGLCRGHILERVSFSSASILTKS